MIPQRIFLVLDGMISRHSFAQWLNAGRNLPILTACSKHCKKCVSVFFFHSVCAIIVLAGPGRVGKARQGLKRDVREFEENACAHSSLDQVHVSDN